MKTDGFELFTPTRTQRMEYNTNYEIKIHLKDPRSFKIKIFFTERENNRHNVITAAKISISITSDPPQSALPFCRILLENEYCGIGSVEYYRFFYFISKLEFSKQVCFIALNAPTQTSRMELKD